MNQLEKAVLAALEHGAPAKTWNVDPDAAVDFGTGRNPFDGMTITAWAAADVAAGRSE